jgi:hypothetical protein
MSFNELSSVISKLKTQGEMVFELKATESEISEFEKTTGISLPSAYKEWLLFSDGGECFLPAGVQFHGVAHKPLIDVNDDDRPSENYIVIGALASGDPVVCEKSGDRISIYNHETGKIENDETYTDFIDFLNNLEKVLGVGG